MFRGLSDLFIFVAIVVAVFLFAGVLVTFMGSVTNMFRGHVVFMASCVWLSAIMTAGTTVYFLMRGED